MDTQEQLETAAQATGLTANRRTLLGVLVGVINVAVIGTVVGPVIGFVTSPLRRKSVEKWVPVLPLDQLAVGEVKEVSFTVPIKDGYASVERKYTLYLRRASEEVIAIDPACTHLGCRVNFQTEKHRFMCPCHGGVFDDEGKVVSGPPPKPLERHRVKIEKGQILVQKMV